MYFKMIKKLNKIKSFNICIRDTTKNNFKKENGSDLQTLLTVCLTDAQFH